MDNINSGYNALLPFANNPRVSSSAGASQSLPQKTYLPFGAGVSGVPLNQRSVILHLAPICYQTHNYDVSTLLRHRTYLYYQYQKTQSLSACMQGASTMAGLLPQLQQALNGYGPVPSFSEGDLLYHPSGGLPISFAQYADRDAPETLQSALPLLTYADPEAVMKGIAELQKLQPLMHDYSCALNSLLQQNSQQLSSHIYSLPVLPEAQSVAYSFEQLQHWLGLAGRQETSLLTGYPVNQLDELKHGSPLYYTPSDAAFSPDHFVGTADTKTLKELEENDLWSSFKQHFDSFNYPGTQIGYQQGAVSSQALKAEIQQESLVVNGSEVAADKGIVLTAVENRSLSAPEKVKQGPLGRCIEFMETQVSDNSGTANRQRLTALFNSWEGQVLFNNRDHLKGKTLLARNEADPRDYTGDSLSVDISSTLQFIDLYSGLIAAEQKPGIMELPRHRRKKLERLAALREIRQFVAGLNSNNPDAAALCRLALQMCGRVRERSLVNQHQLELCGGFAVLQNAWGAKPLMTTRVLLNLAYNHRCSVKTLILGKSKELRVPSIDLSQFSDALADKLLLSTLYDLNKDSSTPGRDAINASFLGLSARPFNQDRWLKASDSIVNPKFIEAMRQASQDRCPVRGVIKGKLRAHLRTLLNDGLARKANKSNVLDIEDGVNQCADNDPKGHAVIFDDFKVEGSNVVFKLYSWGRVYYLKMNQDTFLQNVDKASFVVFNHTATADQNSIFNDINMEEIDSRGDMGFVLCLSGEEIAVPKGVTVRGFSGKSYKYKGDSLWDIGTSMQ